jgi:hypothetical protein
MYSITKEDLVNKKFDKFEKKFDFSDPQTASKFGLDVNLPVK